MYTNLVKNINLQHPVEIKLCLSLSRTQLCFTGGASALHVSAVLSSLCWLSGVSPAPDAQHHPAGVEVSVVCRELVQDTQRPLQGLEGPRSRHRVFVPIRILLVIAVLWQVPPKHVDTHAKLKSQGIVKPQSCEQNEDVIIIMNK